MDLRLFEYPVPRSSSLERFFRKTFGEAQQEAVSTLRAIAATPIGVAPNRICTTRAPAVGGDEMRLLREEV